MQQAAAAADAAAAAEAQEDAAAAARLGEELDKKEAEEAEEAEKSSYASAMAMATAAGDGDVAEQEKMLAGYAKTPPARCAATPAAPPPPVGERLEAEASSAQEQAASLAAKYIMQPLGPQRWDPICKAHPSDPT